MNNFSSVDNVFLGQVVQNLAREIMNFPLKTWDELKQLNGLLRAPTTRTEEADATKGAVIVSFV